MTQTHTGKSLFPAAMLAVLALLQGCATLDKDECKLADWRLIGYQDGVAGKSAAMVGQYREDCAKHAVVPNLDAYRAGREEGLQQYCNISNGYRLGEAGRGFAAVCPTELEGEFRKAYKAGRKIYLARSVVSKTQSHLDQHKQKLTNLEDDRAQKLTALVADDLEADQRVMIVYELNELQQEMNSVGDEIVVLEHDLAKQQSRLDQLTRNNAY